MADQHISTNSTRIEETCTAIYNRYLEVFHTAANANLKETYNDSISDTANEIINEFHTRYLESFLEDKENTKDTEKLRYQLYRHMREWVRMQMVSGMQLIMIRREIEKEPVGKIGDGPKQEVIDYVSARFWNTTLEDALDSLNQQLVKRDTDQAIEAIKRGVPGIDEISVGFLKRYSSRLMWATTYGVILAGWTSKKN